MKANTLLVGSGGTLAYGFLGALSFLDSTGRLDQVTRYVGVSAGSILALLLCAGVNIKTIVRAFFETDFSSLQKVSPVLLLAAYGLDTGHQLMDKVASMLTAAGFSKKLTFGQLKQLTKRDLAIGACDILEKKFTLFTSDTHPELPVLSAVRASVAVPIVFTPEIIDGRFYVDGAVVCGYPIGQCLLEWPESTVIGLRVKTTTRKNRIDGVMDYIQTLFSCVGSQPEWDIRVLAKDNGDKFKDICVEVDQASFLTSPSREAKVKMFESGYNLALELFGQGQEDTKLP